ncbi:MAG: DUF1294 domain-containing protein [Eubacteriales bacterium]|nr:DUF1294 domain-containing protein [Eubacteriales bacterium]
MLWTICTIYLLIINLAAFAAFGLDKYYAIKGKWRISERTLLTLAGAFGAVGAFLGMILFHHKTKKNKFAVSVPMMMALQLLILADLSGIL